VAAADLSGVWNGLYTYGAGRNEHFVAVLIEHGDIFTGTIHETPRLFGNGGQLNANVEGTRAEVKVSFTKTYDGTGGWSHAVSYRGDLNAEATEIEGTWRIAATRGTFLMVRARSAEKSVEARVEEKIGGR
jgi:hypothetical protein